MSGDSVVEELRANEVDQSEFEYVLSRYFGTAVASSPETIRYPATADFALELHYEDGRLVDIVAGPALTRLELTGVRQRIETELLTATGTAVGRVVLFASVPVTGYFRYQNLFQWVPAPAEAPHPPFTMAEHPFLLEFHFRQSPDAGIRQLRRAILERELELLAAGLLEFTIRGHGRLAHHHWVLMQDDVTQPWISAYRQEMYIWPGLVLEGGEFTDIGALPRLAAVDPVEYYARGGIGPDRVLEIPATLTDLVERFFGLPRSERERFLRACFWFQHAHTMRPRSAAFTSMTSAVEALIPTVKGAPVCEQCKRPTGAGPTRMFSEFVDDLAPGASTVETRRRFYGTRSALSHGGSLLHSDRRTWSPHMTGAQIEEWEDIGAMWKLVRLVLVNWLAKQRG
jgi:hypothetical protein